jgi:hypothetical protein
MGVGMDWDWDRGRLGWKGSASVQWVRTWVFVCMIEDLGSMDIDVVVVLMRRCDRVACLVLISVL